MPPLLELEREANNSGSRTDLVGDFEGDLFVGERDEDRDGFRLSLDMLLSERFLEEGFVKMLGRTMRMMLRNRLPAAVVVARIPPIQKVKSGYPCTWGKLVLRILIHPGTLRGDLDKSS